MRYILISALLFSGVAQAQELKKWSLLECVNHAVSNNISVKQSQLDMNSAIEDQKAAKFNFLPNLNGSANQNYNFGSTITAFGTRASANFRSNSFSLNSTVNLFNGFANINTLKQSNIGVDIQDAAIQKMKNDISLNVANAYLQILFAQEQLRITKSQVEVSQEQVDRIKALVDGGVLAEGELYNIESTLATDKQSQVVAENNLLVAKLQLAQLLQLQEPTIEVVSMDVQLDDAQILSNSAQVIYEKALTSFPEIKQAELNVMSAETGVKIARANYYPSLSMSLGMNTIYQHRQGYPDFFTFSDQVDDNFGQSIFFSLNIPIYNRYQFRSNVNKAKINVERIQYGLESERLRMRETIQNAYADAVASGKSFEAAELAVKAQQKSFDYAKERFATGAINSFDFNQIKNTLLNAEAQLIQSKYDYLFKLKVLEFYYGEAIAE